MKNFGKALAATAGMLGPLAVVLLASLPANANTITVGVITVAPDGSGGQLWTYPIIFSNSRVDSSQPTAFNLNDFGPLKTTGSLPTGFSFVGLPVNLTFTLQTPLVGPSFGLPGFQPNNPAVLDVVVTFTGNGSTGANVNTFNLVLDTALTVTTGGLANFFSEDIVATGNLAGSPNAAQQNIITPSGSVVTVPEPASLALLGIGLSALGFSRRRKQS